MISFIERGESGTLNQSRATDRASIHGSAGVVRACAVLSLCVFAAVPLCGYWLFRQSGTAGVVATAVAAFICLMCAGLALIVTHRFRGAGNGVTGLLLAMGLRTGGPLLSAVVLSNGSRMLAEGGIFKAILVFYLLTLAVETFLSVRLLKAGTEAEVV